jgi:hypothetical protein
MPKIRGIFFYDQFDVRFGNQIYGGGIGKFTR